MRRFGVQEEYYALAEPDEAVYSESEPYTIKQHWQDQIQGGVASLPSAVKEWALKWHIDAEPVDGCRGDVGAVYMLSIFADRHYIKVGYSKNLKTRLNAIYSSMPFRLWIGLHWPVQSMKSAERDLHELLAPWWVAGEWFDLPFALVRDTFAPLHEREECGELKIFKDAARIKREEVAK